MFFVQFRIAGKIGFIIKSISPLFKNVVI